MACSVPETKGIVAPATTCARACGGAQRRQDRRLVRGRFLALQHAIESSHRFQAAVAEHVDMHRTDIAALTQLMEAHSVEEPLSPSDLARRLRLSPPATTALLDRLEGTGHVVRERHPDDRRRIVLRLTPSGRRQLGRSLDVLFAAINAAMDNHSHEAKAATATVMDDVAAAVGAAADQIERADTES